MVQGSSGKALGVQRCHAALPCAASWGQRGWGMSYGGNAVNPLHYILAAVRLRRLK